MVLTFIVSLMPNLMIKCRMHSLVQLEQLLACHLTFDQHTTVFVINDRVTSSPLHLIRIEWTSSKASSILKVCRRVFHSMRSLDVKRHAIKVDQVILFNSLSDVSCVSLGDSVPTFRCQHKVSCLFFSGDFFSMPTGRMCLSAGKSTKAGGSFNLRWHSGTWWYFSGREEKKHTYQLVPVASVQINWSTWNRFPPPFPP